MPDLSACEGVEILGQNVQNVVDSFRMFPQLGVQPLLSRGIGELSAGGGLAVAAEHWFPLPAWLEAFYEIRDKVGPAKMTEVGTHVPNNSEFPPHISSLTDALESLDLAYYLNHRRDGRAMFDPATKTTDGSIGHYRYVPSSQPRRATVIAENVPYPCELDRGILIGLGRRFGSNRVTVTHLDEGCRNNGDASCSYRVEW